MKILIILIGFLFPNDSISDDTISKKVNECQRLNITEHEKLYYVQNMLNEWIDNRERKEQSQQAMDKLDDIIRKLDE